MVQRNEDFSESVNLFDFYAIFLPRSGHDLSRNGFVVFVYALYKKSLLMDGFFHEAEIFGPAGGSAPGKVLRT